MLVSSRLAWLLDFVHLHYSVAVIVLESCLQDSIMLAFSQVQLMAFQLRLPDLCITPSECLMGP